jgi:hypothetical protein
MSGKGDEGARYTRRRQSSKGPSAAVRARRAHKPAASPVVGARAVVRRCLGLELRVGVARRGCV